AIRWIVVVVMVPVMDRQLAQIRTREFASAPAADPGIYPERLLPVSLFALGGRPACLGDDAIELAGVFHVARADGAKSHPTASNECSPRIPSPHGGRQT